MPDADAIMAEIDTVLYSQASQPFSGWHDDHRQFDRTALYRPAIQQVKAEFKGLVEAVVRNNLVGGKCLQLGLGFPGSAHAAFRKMFGFVCTVDSSAQTFENAFYRYGADQAHDQFIVGDTHDPETVKEAGAFAPYDLLFIDAGHKYEDILKDFQDYAPMVRPGGIIAFHDAVKRPGYETECETWRVLPEVAQATGLFPILIGDEVGIAFVVKPEPAQVAA